MHEDVGGVEPVNRLVDGHLADVPIDEHRARRRGVVEQLLDGGALDGPCGDRVGVDRRPALEGDPRTLFEEGREPFHEVAYDIARDPSLGRRRVVPRAGGRAEHAVGERRRDPSVLLCGGPVFARAHDGLPGF